MVLIQVPITSQTRQGIRMSRKDDIKKLVAEYQRRLHKLKLQEARFGINTPPETLTEIEDIEAKIKRLQRELKTLSVGDTIWVTICVEGDLSSLLEERKSLAIAVFAGDGNPDSGS